MPKDQQNIRIDKWLWAVRVFKTRNQAAEACKGGKVKINDTSVKPSREVKLNDIVKIQKGPYTRTLKVIGLLSNRVSARIAEEYADDLTPPEEIENLKLMREMNYERRDRGAGRPTKKERREIVKLKRYRLK